MVLPVPDSWKDARFYQQTRGIGEEGRSASGVPLVEGRPVASPIGGGMRSQIVAGVPVGQSKPARAEEAGEGVEDPRSVGEWVPVEEPLFRADASPGAKRQRIEPAPSASGAASVAPRPRTRAGRAHMSTLKAGEAAGVRVTPEVGQSVGFPRRLRIRGKCRACHAFGTRGTPAVDRTPSTDALDQQPPRLLGDSRHWHYSDASACTLGKKATVTCRYCERDVRRDVLSRHRQSKSCQEKQRLYAVGGA